MLVVEEVEPNGNGANAAALSSTPTHLTPSNHGDLHRYPRLRHRMSYLARHKSSHARIRHHARTHRTRLDSHILALFLPSPSPPPIQPYPTHNSLRLRHSTIRPPLTQHYTHRHTSTPPSSPHHHNNISTFATEEAPTTTTATAHKHQRERRLSPSDPTQTAVEPVSVLSIKYKRSWACPLQRRGRRPHSAYRCMMTTKLRRGMVVREVRPPSSPSSPSSLPSSPTATTKLTTTSASHVLPVWTAPAAPCAVSNGSGGGSGMRSGRSEGGGAVVWGVGGWRCRRSSSLMRCLWGRRSCCIVWRSSRRRGFLR